MFCKSVAVTSRGGPEVLQVVERSLHAPSAGGVRVRVLAVPVCGPDVQARYGRTPIAPRVPFVPGYAVVGVVDAVGPGVTRAAEGDRVAALTVSGGYAEAICLREGSLIPMPIALDPAQAVTLILNYIVAFQVMHRSARVKAGGRVLIVGASGGVGTAALASAWSATKAWTTRKSPGRSTASRDCLRMTVTDDGRGIPDSTDLGRFVAQGHFGLAGMRERAAMIGGTLDVQSAVDYGTVVILEVPCNHTAA